MKIALRLLRREPLLAILAIGGLVLCFCLVWLIAAYVAFEVSYDRGLAAVDDVFRFDTQLLEPAQPPIDTPDVPGPFKNGLERMQAPVDTLARAFREQLSIRGAGAPLSGQVLFVDAEFLELFSFETVEGDLGAITRAGGGLALTERLSERLFGTTHSVGKLVQIRKDSFPIVAVIRNLPENSHLAFDALSSTNSTAMEDRENLLTAWNVLAGSLYGKLKPGANMADLDRVSTRVWNELAPPPKRAVFTKNSDHYRTLFVPVSAIHFKSSSFGDFKPAGDPRLMVVAPLVGFLLYAASLVNFVTLMNLLVARRQRELAIRRYLGATAGRLILVIAAQTALVSIVAVAVALALAAALLPTFARLCQRPLSGADLFSLPVVSAMLIAVAVAVLAGSLFPGHAIVRARPHSALSARVSETGTSLAWRRVFAFFQCAAAVWLLAVAIGLAAQTQFVIERGPGFDPNDLYHVSMTMNMASPESIGFKEAVSRLPGVMEVSASSDIPSKGDWRQAAKVVAHPGDPAAVLDLQSVGSGFFGIYGVSATVGRLFEQRDVPADLSRSDKVILNRAARALLGLPSDLEAVGRSVNVDGRDSTVIGVVPDLHYRAAHEAPAASIFVSDPAMQEELSIKVRSGSPDLSASLQTLSNQRFPDSALVLTKVADELEAKYSPGRQMATALLGASGVAAGVAFVGIYGLAGYFVKRRQIEIAIRRIYGAQFFEVTKLVLRELCIIAAVGTLVAVPIAIEAIRRYQEGFFLRAPPSATPYIAAIGSIFVLVVLGGGYQAWRAYRVPPDTLLRPPTT